MPYAEQPNEEAANHHAAVDPKGQNTGASPGVATTLDANPVQGGMIYFNVLLAYQLDLAIDWLDAWRFTPSRPQLEPEVKFAARSLAQRNRKPCKYPG